MKTPTGHSHHSLFCIEKPENTGRAQSAQLFMHRKKLKTPTGQSHHSLLGIEKSENTGGAQSSQSFMH
eukprot:9491682-Lingulodinium_polyedra.AAC.1